jgi:alpha-L-rhamnosidase
VKDYTTWYPQLVADFNKSFYKGGSVGYADGMQAANILALALPGVVEAGNVADVVAALVADINKHGHHTCGIVSIAQLFPVLSANGQHDLALALAQQTSYPSYGWMFTNVYENATTLWELWDSPLEGPEMDSRNHIMFGTISAWFYRDVAGIQLNGLEEIVIRPRQSFDMSLMPHLHAEVVTVKGPVTVDYERRGDGSEIEMTVNVPINTNGVVMMEPLVKGGKCQIIKEGGVTIHSAQKDDSVYAKSLSKVGQVEGVNGVSVDAETGVVSVKVAAGKYTFTVKWE